MAPTAADPVFVDTNLLVFAKQAQSPFHMQATAKLQALAAAGHPLWISRQILQEYLVAMSHPAALTSPVPMVNLIADVQSFEQQFFVSEDGPGVTAQLLKLRLSARHGRTQLSVVAGCSRRRHRTRRPVRALPGLLAAR